MTSAPMETRGRKKLLSRKRLQSSKPTDISANPLNKATKRTDVPREVYKKSTVTKSSWGVSESPGLLPSSKRGFPKKLQRARS